MTTIAIFGGTGYAGSAIRDEALKRGHRVMSVTRNVPADAPAAAGLEFREGSVHDASLVNQVAADADVVVVAVHFARVGQVGDLRPGLRTGVRRRDRQPPASPDAPVRGLLRGCGLLRGGRARSFLAPGRSPALPLLGPARVPRPQALFETPSLMSHAR